MKPSAKNTTKKMITKLINNEINFEVYNSNSVIKLKSGYNAFTIHLSKEGAVLVVALKVEDLENYSYYKGTLSQEELAAYLIDSLAVYSKTGKYTQVYELAAQFEEYKK